MSFYYYLPGATAGILDRDSLRKAGLGVALRDCLETQLAFQERLILHQVHANGPHPERRSGVVVIPQPPEGLTFLGRLGYYPDEQEWRDCGTYWLGWSKAHRPTPLYLARPTRVAGYDELLGDGQVWHCPTIREQGAFPNLPRSMGVNAAGEFEMRVLPEFDWAWQLSEEIIDTVFGVKSLAFSEFFRMAVGALSLNYRIGPQEASQLALITTETYERVFGAAFDWPVVKELLPAADTNGKKKDGESARGHVSTSPGPEGGGPITAPAVATCIY